MDIGWSLWYSVLLGITVIIFLVLDVWRRKTHSRLPPGPSGWPVVGNPLQDIFGAGSDTTATTVEWAMAELIRNPEKMKRVQAELDEVVGRERMVEECDAERLPYLRAVVKVFRLHPAVPFLIPHRADYNCEIAGFVIPNHTQIIVNVWAIGRNPSIWKEPLKFLPERFIETEMSSVDYRGQNLELIPFGAGRRMCPSNVGVAPPLFRVGTSPGDECGPSGHERQVWTDTSESGAIGSHSQATRALRNLLKLD